MSNPTIQLAANSVYITTNSIMSEGFHWSLYVTDKDRKATRHDWAQAVGLREQYRSKPINPVTTYSKNNAVLAYLKVRGCSPPDAEKMKEICASTFAGSSKPTVKENRQAGLTCRTWVLQVLKILEAEGFLVRENDSEGIEKTVRAISEEQERKLVEETFEISFVGEI